MNKIVVGFASGGTSHDDFWFSLMGWAAYDGNSRQTLAGIIPKRGIYIDLNRNLIAREFLKTKGDYLLMLDNDIVFHQEVPYALLDKAIERDTAIYSALYFSFIIDGKLRPVWFVDSLDTPGGIANVGSFDMGQIVPLAAVGMGCCLIRRDVFEKLAAVPEYAESAFPFFGRAEVYLKEHGIKIPEGEDISLCLRARKLGLKVEGDSNIEVKHLKTVPLDFSLFRTLYEAATKDGASY